MPGIVTPVPLPQGISYLSNLISFHYRILIIFIKTLHFFAKGSMKPLVISFSTPTGSLDPFSGSVYSLELGNFSMGFMNPVGCNLSESVSVAIGD